jgi:hypothetical protein
MGALWDSPSAKLSAFGPYSLQLWVAGKSVLKLITLNLIILRNRRSGPRTWDSRAERRKWFDSIMPLRILMNVLIVFAICSCDCICYLLFALAECGWRSLFLRCLRCALYICMELVTSKYSRLLHSDKSKPLFLIALTHRPEPANARPPVPLRLDACGENSDHTGSLQDEGWPNGERCVFK